MFSTTCGKVFINKAFRNWSRDLLGFKDFLGFKDLFEIYGIFLNIFEIFFKILKSYTGFIGFFWIERFIGIYGIF